MKNIFKSKPVDIANVADGKLRIAKRLAGYLIHLQTVWALWMNKRTAGFSRRAKIMVLVGIAGLFCAFSIYSITQVFQSGIIPKIHIDKISRNRPTIPLDVERPRTTDRQLTRIQQFKFFMDSLARSPSGRVKRDSILQHNKALMDSIKMIEEMYGLENRK